ncbi:MAG TPA: hypothetical protein VL171_15350 [Verrucomicrobiae bacterium]|nr:hypothetical protein [Verrucomicrobiae bacterium]
MSATAAVSIARRLDPTAKDAEKAAEQNRIKKLKEDLQVLLLDNRRSLDTPRSNVCDVWRQP